MQYADVILPLKVTGVLTYGIPTEMQENVCPGIRVEVNLGKNKHYAAIVLRTHNHRPEAYQVKPIKSIIDDSPVVLPAQLSFWKWIADYYMCQVGEVMNAALPAHLKLMSETLLLWDENVAEPPLGLEDHAFMLSEALFIKKQLTIDEINLILEGKNVAKAINELLEAGIAIVSELLEERYKPKKEKIVKLCSKYEDELEMNRIFQLLEKKPKQLELLMYFFQLQQKEGIVLSKELISKCGRSAMNSLLDKQILRIENIAIDRLKLDKQKERRDFQLNPAQEIAYQSILEHWITKSVCVLHGVTGSGKTLVYIKLIKELIKEEDGQALYLLPEIALTTHVVSRLRAYFGEELGVYHSRFSNNERVEIWNKVKDKKYKVIVGPRSAVWLPFETLKCIIVDEEHDSSYKQQDPAPRFHARDAAIYLANLHHAKVLLGSATPAVETATNVKKQKFAYVALNERYQGMAMPSIKIIHARETQAALSNIFTIPLLEAIGKTTNMHRQVILFQNKRGYAPFLLCGQCGWVPHCKYCDVSMSYHKYTDKMHCHYCGSKYPPIKHCLQCGNPHIMAKNFGTEKVEEELHRIFPKLSIARMDLDSMRNRVRQTQILDDFAKGKIDVLIGTQMVVKGLDFENVRLVGILSADSLLTYPDFRVNERAFQLMEQVSGRAGRTDGKGEVIIQAHKTDHKVLQWVQNHDYSSMFKTEYKEREKFRYPPFTRIIKLICKHRDATKTIAAAQFLAIELKKTIDIHGPADPLVPRVKNYYLQELIIRTSLDSQSIGYAKKQIAAAILKTIRLRGNSSIQIIVDVDVI